MSHVCTGLMLTGRVGVAWTKSRASSVRKYSALRPRSVGRILAETD